LILFSIVINATEFEVARQVRKYVEGNPTGQETRTFDVMANETVLTRRKEGAIDYRFMPEPVSLNLVTCIFCQCLNVIIVKRICLHLC